MAKLLDHRGSEFAITQETNSSRKQLVTEAGAGGVSFFSGILQSDEFNAKLTGSQAIQNYDKMRRSDAQVVALLNAVQLPILSASWTIELPEGEAGVDFPEDILEFARDQFFRKINFDATLRHALSCVWAGFSWFEKVYEIVNGKFEFANIAPRLASTLWCWDVDNQGKLVGLTQRVRKGVEILDIDLPRDKVALFTFQQEANNYEGISLLRPVYKHWFIKDALYRIDAIRTERFGIGVPVITLPAEFTDAMFRQAELIGKNWRGAEQSFLIKFEGMLLELVQMDAGKALDLIPTIKHHNEEIAKAGLAQFLNYGHTQSGSRSLGDTTVNFFYDAEEALAENIARSLERELLWPLLDFNFAGQPRPRVTFSDLGTVSLTELVGSLTNLKDYVTTDFDTENYLRKRLSMPLKTEEQQAADDAVKTAVAQAKVDAAAQAAATPEPDNTPAKTPEELGGGEDTPVEAHQHRPDCGHVRLARLPSEVVENEEGWWRPLTKVERHVALRQIEGKMMDTKDRVVRALASVRDAWAEYLVGEASKAIPQGPVAIQKVSLTDAQIRTAEELIRPIITDLWKFGRDQVRNELDSQAKEQKLTLTRPKTHEATIVARQLGAAMFRDVDISAKDAQALINSRVTRAVGAVETSLDNAVHAAAMGYWRTQGNDEMDAEEMATTIDDISGFGEKAARFAAGLLVGEALNLGRDFEAQRSKDQINTAIYSAILDTNTCDNCDSADGAEEEVGTEEYYDMLPPLDSSQFGACSGNERCRCILVYDLAGE